MTANAPRDIHHATIRYFREDAPRVDRLYRGKGELVDGGVVEAFGGWDRKGRDLRTRLYEKTVIDARGQPGGLQSYNLEQHGFCFIRAPEPVADFKNTELLLKEYQPKVIEAVKKASPTAKRAFWMSHVRRSEDVPGGPVNAYARIAHSDYGPGFEPLLRTMLENRYGVPAEEAATCGICVLGFWTPIERTAFKDPLCLLDSSTFDMEKEALQFTTIGDLGYTKRPDAARMPQAAQDAPAIGPIYAPNHRWIYCSDMTEEEAVVFKQYDFRPNVSTRISFHHSIPDSFHEAWAECPGRRSIEVRVVLTYDDKDGASSSPKL